MRLCIGVHLLGSRPGIVNQYLARQTRRDFFYLGLPAHLSGEQKRNYKLAEKLAFFLWCSVPDDRLLEAASAGTLTTPPVLESEIARMLKDERSRRWVENFADQ